MFLFQIFVSATLKFIMRNCVICLTWIKNPSTHRRRCRQLLEKRAILFLRAHRTSLARRAIWPTLRLVPTRSLHRRRRRRSFNRLMLRRRRIN